MRYFFHIRHGETLIEDPDGEEFASLEAPHAEAVAAAREIMAYMLLAGRAVDGR